MRAREGVALLGSGFLKLDGKMMNKLGEGLCHGLWIVVPLHAKFGQH